MHLAAASDDLDVAEEGDQVLRRVAADRKPRALGRPVSANVPITNAPPGTTAARSRST